jgi:ABC-type transport system involved in cytochrome c biogenesis permease subunit
MLKTILKPLASLTLTVVLLALSMVLIYAGTCAQVDKDIWRVQHEYFHTAVAWINVQDLIPRFSARPPSNWGSFPFPGGYIIGGLLLVNLLAAHTVRFKFSRKDFWLLPQMALMGFALYFWQQNHTTLPIVVASVVGLAFLVTLFLVHAKRAGVIVIHLGLILLLIGEGITSGAAKEARMTITEGTYANYAEDIREPELAVVDKSAPDKDRHAIVPQPLLKKGATLADDDLPFTVRVDDYFANSAIVDADKFPSLPSLADRAGAWTVQNAPPVTGVMGGAVDRPSAFVTAIARDGKELGRYLVTVMATKPHVVEVGGKSYELALRFQRDYKPYQIHLKDFRFDRYTGTNVPRNYSSDVTLVDPRYGENRDVRIWMNNPLRYRGETFFQSGFDDKTEVTTILQVVRNPAATMPYVAIMISMVGLVVHFGVLLVNFLSRRDLSGAELALGFVGLLAAVVIGASAYVTGGVIGVVVTVVGLAVSALAVFLVRGRGRENAGPAAAPPASAARSKTSVATKDEGKYELAPQSRFRSARFLVPLGVLLFCLFYVFSHAAPRPISDKFDFETFAKLPLSYEGRVQPFDSLARNALKVLNGRETAYLPETEDGKEVETRVKPIVWLLDVFAQRKVSEQYRIFVIDHPDVKSLFGVGDKRRSFALQDLRPNFSKFVEQHRPLLDRRRAGEKTFNPYQTAVLELGDRLNLYQTVSGYPSLHIVPPPDAKSDWLTLGAVAATARQTGASDPVAQAFLRALEAYEKQDAAGFDRAARDHELQIQKKLPAAAARVGFEAWFNRFDPFVMSMAFYVLVFVLAAGSWVGFSKPLARAAFWVLVLAMVVHTFGLAARIYMSGRPPVTNLASSAIFIGWGMVVFAICLELIYKNGIGSVLAAVAGFPTLMIAHKLSLDGDTMKVLQAVLDTNIWLATHVVTITLGYAATFLAGLIGIAYVVTGVFTRVVDADLRKTFGRMMYGITCFAILFSFVGTILGGIWADQSWGRFWGWDPKENGAVLIVLANAIFLHARWGGLVKERGMANIAIFGNIVTAWSYFGTNFLGVGLHAYGFLSNGVMWLLIFIGSQLFFIGCGLLPTNAWKSFAGDDDSKHGPLTLA